LSKSPSNTPGSATPGSAAPGCGALRQWTHTLQVATRGKGLYEFTGQIAAWLAQQDVSTGLLTLFVQHTSASLLIQENADPDVAHDLNVFFSRIAPEDNRLYRHTMEGPDDMPAHIRAALTATQLSIPVERGRMALGTWQGVYLFEHRAAPHRRSVALHLLGDAS
jgi:secondary thiamine-phosphate synthase enzyme